MTTNTNAINLDAVKERRARAFKELCAICSDPKNFRMRIPRQEDDTDSVIMAALDDVETLVDEVSRLRSMIQYALDGPEDWHALKSILFDTLNGCTGADNVEEVRARFGCYQSDPAARSEGGE